MQTSLNLTVRQREFLADYVPDICHAENKWLERSERHEFVQAVGRMDFDGQVQAAGVRVAKNLQEKGLFSAFYVHRDRTGHSCVYVRFSAVGAEAVFDVMRRGS